MKVEDAAEEEGTNSRKLERAVGPYVTDSSHPFFSGEHADMTSAVVVVYRARMQDAPQEMERN